VLAAFGFSNPLIVVPLLRLPFVALAIYAAYLSARLAKSLAGDAAGARVGILAALLAAFSPLALLLDFRTTTEAASGVFVVLAVLAVADGKMVRAGAWMALLVFLRPGNGLVGLGAVASLAWGRRFRDSARLALGAAPVALAGGILDWITWGSPFHHLVEYGRFNWIESGAKIFGIQAVWGYGPLLFKAAPLIAIGLVPAAVALMRAGGRARLPVVVAGIYLLVHSALAHKEARFLLPILPLLAALVAAGMALLVGGWLSRREPSAILIAAGASVMVLGTQQAFRATYADLYDPRGEPSDKLVFGKRHDVNRLLAAAGDRGDLCGMLILGLMPNELFSGGTTYLHRDVLLVSPQRRQSWMFMARAANYAVAEAALLPPEWHRVAIRGDVALLGREGGCSALPEIYRPKYKRPTLAR